MKPNIAGWEADFGKEMMTKGKAWLNFTWSGDAVWAMEEASAVGVDLGYEVPLEGSNIWYDGWAIPKYVANVKRPVILWTIALSDIVSRNMEVTRYVTVATPEILIARSYDATEFLSDVSYQPERVQIDRLNIRPEGRERCASDP